MFPTQTDLGILSFYTIELYDSVLIQPFVRTRVTQRGRKT